MKRSQIINEARTWLGTPFHHQGRVKGVGVDCIGLIIGVGRAVGTLPETFDATGYGREPHNHSLPKGMVKHLTIKCSVIEDVEGCGCGKKHKYAELDRARHGDILLFRFLREPQHVGFYTRDNTIIHAYDGSEKCVEHRLDDKWKKRVVAIYEWPGVVDG